MHKRIAFDLHRDGFAINTSVRDGDFVGQRITAVNIPALRRSLLWHNYRGGLLHRVRIVVLEANSVGSRPDQEWRE